MTYKNSSWLIRVQLQINVQRKSLIKGECDGGKCDETGKVNL